MLVSLSSFLLIFIFNCSPDSLQERKYVEPISACGDRNGQFDINDVLTKRNGTNDHFDRKPGLLPRIKRLSVKRNSKENPKKYKYNLEVTPAERLFGSAPLLHENSEYNGVSETGEMLNEVDARENDSEYRPTTRLDNYKYTKPISVNVQLGEKKLPFANEFSHQLNPFFPKSSHSVVIPSSPPSSLLLQVAPDQNHISSNSGYLPESDKNGTYQGSKDVPQAFQKVIYADIDHHHPQTKG